MQPVIYEKHIHEHHQPIIHEKHQTLIEEKHIPFVKETHLQATNQETRQEIVHEVYDQAVVTESFSQPVVHRHDAQTIVEVSGTPLGGQQFVQGQSFQTTGVSQGFNQGYNQGFSTGGQTIIEETTTTHTDRIIPGAAQGYGYSAGNTYLGDNQTYVNEVDEFGRPKKAGFFNNLKTKMGGSRKNKEPKII